MKSRMFLVSTILALTTLYQLSVSAQTPGPTTPQPGTGSQKAKPIIPLDPEVATWRPVMSIEEVQFQPPLIKVLVRNRGKVKSKPGDIAQIRIILESISGAYNDKVEHMSFWVTGKPKPQPVGGWLGTGKPLTQQDVDALPPTTKIQQPFEKLIPMPAIAPAQSVWLNIDFTLPDPGSYVAPPKVNPFISGGLAAKGGSPFMIDASKLDECANLAAFFASNIRLTVYSDFRRPSDHYYVKPPEDPPVRMYYQRQIPQAYFNYMDFPPDKYTGKCK